jgi:hypothetical protein
MDRLIKENQLATTAPKKTWGGQSFLQGSFFVATFVTGRQEMLRNDQRFLAANQ